MHHYCIICENPAGSITTFLMGIICHVTLSDPNMMLVHYYSHAEMHNNFVAKNGRPYCPFNCATYPIDCSISMRSLKERPVHGGIEVLFMKEHICETKLVLELTFSSIRPVMNMPDVEGQPCNQICHEQLIECFDCFTWESSSETVAQLRWLSWSSGRKYTTTVKSIQLSVVQCADMTSPWCFETVVLRKVLVNEFL